MKKFYLAVVALFCTAIAFSQGVTTSAISGQVTDENGEPLGGATVVAVHVPTGSTYGAATDFDGYYRISGMRAGGRNSSRHSPGHHTFMWDRRRLPSCESLRCSGSIRPRRGTRE